MHWWLSIEQIMVDLLILALRMKLKNATRQYPIIGLVHIIRIVSLRTTLERLQPVLELYSYMLKNSSQRPLPYTMVICYSTRNCDWKYFSTWQFKAFSIVETYRCRCSYRSLWLAYLGVSDLYVEEQSVDSCESTLIMSHNITKYIRSFMQV